MITMETIFIIFLAFVSVVILFAFLVIVRDIVREYYTTKRAREKEEAKLKQVEAAVPQIVYVQAPLATAPAVAPAQPVVPAAPVAPVAPVQPEPAPVAPVAPVAPAAPAVVEEPAVTVAAKEEPVEEPVVEETVAEGTVAFSADKGQTLDEKYMDLDAANKKRYDEIIKYAAAVEGSRRFKNLRYEEYKIGALRIVRLLIKRGIIVCEFMMQNTNFKSYMAENKVSAKQSATVIKVTDDDTVQVIKDTIDIVVKAIAEEREFKKQLAREKRKAKRQEQA